ncbi:MAG: beta-galactosidase trimerization domain-containing protein [Clostridia bacterium]|nr:beta-galactosidase trimerization domain-containing protein [Clostridia bacterium]
MKKEGIDFNDDSAVAAFSARVQRDFMQRIRDTVPKDKRLFVNGSKQWHGKDINSHFEVECLPSVWGYDYFAPNAAFARTLYDTVVYMNGRFQVCWGDFGGYKGKPSLENDFYDALTQGVQFMMGDHLHPANLPEKDIYKDLGDIYGRLKRYEKWTDNAKFIPEIAILTDNKYIGAGGYGAARMLSELKYTYDIVWYGEDFSKYPLVILPDNLLFDKDFAERIRTYLNAGGKVISSGYSGLNKEKDSFVLSEWGTDFVSVIEKGANENPRMCDAGYTTYFKLNYETSLADMCYSQYETAISMRASEGTLVLADEYASYFKKSGWTGEHFIYYTPPKSKTENAVVTVNSSENVAQISFPIFSAFRKSAAPVYKNIIKTLLCRFMPENLIKADGIPSTSRVTLTGNSEYKLLHVKVTYPEIRGKLGVIEEHNVLPCGRVVAILGEYTSVSRLPETEAVPFEVKDGYTYVTLPEIVGYDMFLLK